MRLARKARRLTQADVATEFKIKRESVAGWEANDSKPDPAKFPVLVRLYSTTYDWLYEGKGEPPATLSKDAPKRSAAKEADEIQSLWLRLSEEGRQQALGFIRGLLASQAPPPEPPPPSPQPPPVAPSSRVTPRFKEQPDLPTIGGRRAPHVYLQEWLDHRNMEPERLAQRLYVDVEEIHGLLDGSEPYDQEILWHIAKALTTSLDSLYGLPPKDEAKPTKKDGKKAAKR